MEKEENLLLNDDIFKIYINFTNSYFRVLEELLPIYKKLDKLNKFEKRIKKIWNNLINNRQIYNIFSLGYSAHLLSIISILNNNEEEYWKWITLTFIISIICRTITLNNSKFNKIWDNLHLNYMNLGINLIKKQFDIHEDHNPKMQNKLIDILLNAGLSKEDYYYFDHLIKLKSKKAFEITDINKFHELRKEINRNKSINDLIKVLYYEDYISQLLDDKEFLKAIEQAEEIEKLIKKSIKSKSVKQYLIARINQNLFRIELKKHNYDQAERHGKKVVNIFNNDQVRRKYDLLLFLIEFGYFYIEERDRYALIFDRSKDLINQALNVAVNKRNKSYQLFMKIFESLGELEWRNEKYIESLTNFFKAKCFYLIYNDPKNDLFDNLIGIFFIYLERSEFDLQALNWNKNW
ncbi:MAG: hypothetical protein GF329_19040 [Candidatus Lokiarchaeota archaeon]|nr:hypothetical protein [Candidatus Lokiarchaeota archaeon]